MEGLDNEETVVGDSGSYLFAVTRAAPPVSRPLRRPAGA